MAYFFLGPLSPLSVWPQVLVCISSLSLGFWRRSRFLFFSLSFFSFCFLSWSQTLVSQNSWLSLVPGQNSAGSLLGQLDTGTHTRHSKGSFSWGPGPIGLWVGHMNRISYGFSYCHLVWSPEHWRLVSFIWNSEGNSCQSLLPQTCSKDTVFHHHPHGQEQSKISRTHGQLVDEWETVLTLKRTQPILFLVCSSHVHVTIAILITLDSVTTTKLHVISGFPGILFAHNQLPSNQVSFFQIITLYWCVCGGNSVV